METQVLGGHLGEAPQIVTTMEPRTPAAGRSGGRGVVG